MCTGNRVIEFVAKTPIEMPHNDFSLNGHLHLHKCEKSEESSHRANDFVLYDGHFTLDELTPFAVRSAIASISVGLNRMAFAYGSNIEWVPKYSMVQHNPHSKPAPTEEDLKVLESMLIDFPNNEDAIVLDICIDWFHRGELARKKNVFLAFLCYYIALESVVIAITEGDAELGFNYEKETRTERKDRVNQGIRSLHDELYETDPEKFIKEAYFNHVVGLKQRTKQICERVFGEGHEYMKSLFEKNEDGFSLSDLRSELAHGGATLLSPEHRKMIRERLPELAEIVTNFVKKIILKPDQEFPKWSGTHSFSMYPSDPRDTMIMTDERAAGGATDWKIKPEWMD